MIFNNGDSVQVGVAVVVILLLLALTVVQVIGSVHLTNFAFRASKNNGQYCVSMSDNAMVSARITMVLFWLMIAGNFVLALVA
jgi:type II secretory pathway component PulK